MSKHFSLIGARINYVFSVGLIALTLAALSAAGVVAAESNTPVSPTVMLKTFAYDAYTQKYSEIGIGSGTVIDSRGTVLTSSHVLTGYYGDSAELIVGCLLFDIKKEAKCEYIAQVKANDTEKDVALLKLSNSSFIDGEEISGFNFAEPNFAEEAELGEELSVYGFPFTGGEYLTFTKGSVSGFFRQTNDGDLWIKTDAKIDTGNSGGTVYDERNKFIGMPSFVNYEYDTLGFIMPLSVIESWILSNQNATVEMSEELAQKYKDFIESRQKIAEFVNGGDIEMKSKHYGVELADGWEFEDFLEAGETASKLTLAKDDQLKMHIDVTLHSFDIDPAKFFEGFKKSQELNDFAVSEVSDVELADGKLKGKLFYQDYNENYVTAYTYILFYKNYEFSLVVEDWSYGSFFYDTPTLDKTDGVYKSEDEILGMFSFDFDGLEKPDPVKVIEEDSPVYSVDLSDTNWELLADTSARGGYGKVNTLYSSDLEGWVIIQSQKDALWAGMDIESYYSEQFEYDMQNYYGQALDKKLHGMIKVNGNDVFVYSHNIEKADNAYKLVHMVYVYPNQLDYMTVSVIIPLELLDQNKLEIDKVLNGIYFGEGKDSWQEHEDAVIVGELQQRPVYFSDVPESHPQFQEITYLKGRNVIEGNPDGTFRPESTLNRAEMAKLLIGTFDYFDPNYGFYENCFTDVADQWFAAFVCRAKELGTVKGYEGGYFSPAGTVNKAEALKMLLKSSSSIYEEEAEGELWYQIYVNRAYEMQLIDEVEFAEFNPAEEVSRAEFSVWLYKVLKNHWYY